MPPDENSFILWYDSSRVLLQKQGDGQIRFPRFADLPAADWQWIYLFSIGDDRFYWLNQRQQPAAAPFVMESIYSLRHLQPRHYALRRLGGLSSAHLVQPSPLLRPLRTPLQPDGKRMMRCLMMRDKILLSKYNGRVTITPADRLCRGRQTIEETVKREVWEEVGLRQKYPRRTTEEPALAPFQLAAAGLFSLSWTATTKPFS